MCERRARDALARLGDPEAGEWGEWSGSAFHLRRRLSFAEAVPVGPALDIRGTPEARRRVDMLPGAVLPYVPSHVLAEELGV